MGRGNFAISCPAVLVVGLLIAVAPLFAQTGRVRIRVTDFVDGSVPTAEASLLGPNGKTQRTEPADAAGEILWTDLPLGDSVIVVSAPGYRPRRLTVTSRNDRELLVEVRFDIGSMEEEEVIVSPGVPLPATQSLDSSSSSESPQPKRPKRRWWQIHF